MFRLPVNDNFQESIGSQFQGVLKIRIVTKFNLVPFRVHIAPSAFQRQVRFRVCFDDA
jgi:hypothetical protein